MSVWITDSTIDIIAAWIFENKDECRNKNQARSEAEELINYLIKNGVCLIERESCEKMDFRR